MPLDFLNPDTFHSFTLVDGEIVLGEDEIVFAGELAKIELLLNHQEEFAALREKHKRQLLAQIRKTFQSEPQPPSGPPQA